MNYLQIVNKVMLRLREDEVASVQENTYSKLIGEFVQQGTSEVEDAREWNALRTSVQVTTIAGDPDYALTGAGASYSIECVFNDTDDTEIRKAPSSAWMTHKLLDNNLTQNTPGYYDINGVDANLDPVVNFYPVPDAVYTIYFNMKIKTTLSADTDESPVPYLPILLKALLLAVDERGDDAGMTVDVIQGQFNNALANATAFDMQLNEDEGIWEVE